MPVRCFVFDAIRQLMAPPPEPEVPKTPIGFRTGEPETSYGRRPRRRVAEFAGKGHNEGFPRTGGGTMQERVFTP
jgi:hypothetical protein